MQYVFGDAFICDDNETAKKVAFDPRVRMRCVTLEGDVYNPSGVLSGGSSGDSGMELLKKVKELYKLEEELRYVEHKLQEGSRELTVFRERLLA
jgi:structural maintenance of chromosome 2